MIEKINTHSDKADKNVPSKISDRNTKGFDPKKYFGKVVRGLDGITYQKAIRND